MEQGGFAHAGFPHEGDALAGGNFEVEIVKHNDSALTGAVMLGEANSAYSHFAARFQSFAWTSVY